MKTFSFKSHKFAPFLNPRRVFVTVLSIFIICVGIALAFGYFRTVHYSKDSLRQSDVQNAQSQDYSGVFLSMYSPDAFNADDFAYYRGVPTLQAFHTFETLADIGDYVDTIFDSGNTITSVYIGMDPAIIGEQFGFHASLYHKEYQKQLLDVITAHPETHFEFLLPYYSLEYWSELPGADCEELLNTYRDFVNIFAPHSNVTIYYLGFEDWLIGNPGNYDAYNTCNLSVTSHLLALTFKDEHYKVTFQNLEERLSITSELISQNQANLAAGGTGLYGYDFSQYEFVFFGDSVIGNFTDSLSIPGVVEGNGATKAYNLGQGGTTATIVDGTTEPKIDSTTGAEIGEEPIQSLNTVVDAFLAKAPDLLNSDSQPKAGLLAYMEDHGSSTKKTCFVINYGLNDYFEGYPVSTDQKDDIYTYKGSLRTAVNKLQEAYPDCIILLLTPTFCSYYQNGTTPQSTKGGVLTDYVDAVIQLSEEFSDTDSVYCIDNYHNVGIDSTNYEQYLSDGCHPDDNGRFLIGIYLLECLSKIA